MKKIIFFILFCLYSSSLYASTDIPPFIPHKMQSLYIYLKENNEENTNFWYEVSKIKNLEKWENLFISGLARLKSKYYVSALYDFEYGHLLEKWESGIMMAVCYEQIGNKDKAYNIARQVFRYSNDNDIAKDLATDIMDRNKID